MIVSSEYCLSLMIANLLRKNDIFVVLQNASNIKSQLKKALKINCKYFVVIGNKELKSGTLSVKNIDTQEQLCIPRDDLLSYLKGDKV